MIQEGTQASISLVVADSDTAIALGSGDVPVLGTPRVVALCEQAAVAALSGHLAEGATSVGVSVNLDHVAASAIGAAVVARAVITEVDGNRISFAIDLREGGAQTARGTHIRYVVDRQRFLPD